MAKQRKSAYGGPDEEKQVTVSLDGRLLAVLGLILAFGGAVAFGVWSAGRGEGVRTAAAPGSLSVPNAEAGEQALQDAKLKSLGLNPDTTTVIGEGGGTVMNPLDPAQIQPPSAQDAMMNPAGASSGLSGDIIQPNPDALGLPPDLVNTEGAVPFDVNQDRPSADHWDHEVLANFEDPNVTKPEHAPVRTEDVSELLDGPRLGISDLNTLYTYDFGPASMTEPVSHNFTAKNVGDADLEISRVYTGCGCTATRLADVVLDAAGWVVDPDGEHVPYVLAPGEAAEFTVEFDPRAEGRPGALSKYIQIFSNDPSKHIFDPTDPLSHETRFRIVVEPRYGYDPDAEENGG